MNGAIGAPAERFIKWFNFQFSNATHKTWKILCFGVVDVDGGGGEK